MSTLQLTTLVKALVDGVPYEGGSLDSPFNITITGDAHFQVVTVATETTADIFNVDTDIGDFDLLWVQADFDLFVELTVDKGGDVGTVPIPLYIPGSGTANSFGRPLIIPSNISKANYTINFAGGTNDVIDRVRVRNESTTQAAKVLIAAIT